MTKVNASETPTFLRGKGSKVEKQSRCSSTDQSASLGSPQALAWVL